jgi:hypothetical protein
MNNLSIFKSRKIFLLVINIFLIILFYNSLPSYWLLFYFTLLNISLLAGGLIRSFIFLILYQKMPEKITRRWDHALLATLFICAIFFYKTKNINTVIIWALFINLSYAAAKWGCYTFGCCNWKKKIKFISLPILEGTFSCLGTLILYLLYRSDTIVLILLLIILHLFVRSANLFFLINK